MGSKPMIGQIFERHFLVQVYDFQLFFIFFKRNVSFEVMIKNIKGYVFGSVISNSINRTFLIDFKGYD